MSTNNLPMPNTSSGLVKALAWIGAGIFILAMAAFGALAALFMTRTAAGQQAGLYLQWIISPDSAKTTWYITRAAGLTSFLLLWLSTFWGLALPARIFDGKLHGAFTFEFHQFISLLAIGFTLAHVVVLMFDQYLPFSLAQILFPFLSEYRPFWTGLGVLTLYIVLLVSVTFYLKDKIGMRAFRAIHVLSLLAFFAAALHGLMAGTDSALPVVQVLYAGTTLSVVFLTVYWLFGRTLKPEQRAKRTMTTP
jgi:methionine sulfoxide reductase heme-binding subunit